MPGTDQYHWWRWRFEEDYTSSELSATSQPDRTPEFSSVDGTTPWSTNLNICMNSGKPFSTKDLSVRFVKLELNSSSNELENNLATARNFERLVHFDKAANKIEFNLEDSRIEMKHAGTWQVQILHKQNVEVGSDQYPLLSFNMIIVTPCAHKNHATVSLNPDPFVWPLEDYTWAVVSRKEADEESDEVNQAWSSNHPGFTQADCSLLAS